MTISRIDPERVAFIVPCERLEREGVAVAMISEGPDIDVIVHSDGHSRMVPIGSCRRLGKPQETKA